MTADEVLYNPIIDDDEYLTPAEKRDVKWFRHVWTTYLRPGMHLRAMHYKLVSVTPPVPMAPGIREHHGQGRPKRDAVLDAICLPYENTAFCWDQLNTASLRARKSGFVDGRLFSENRAPKPRLNAFSRTTPTPTLDWRESESEDGVPEPYVLGYDYQDADQPVTIEVWAEKTTMDHILAPLCRDLRVNYQPLAGMFSHTRVVEQLDRAKRLGKPVRIFYISDFDPAGLNMPFAFAEALKGFGAHYAKGIDIKMTHLALTVEQVQRYGLPLSAVKKGPYSRDFIAKYGDGCTELDALEAIVPGVLERIVRAAIESQIDEGLYGKCLTTAGQSRDAVRAAWRDAIQPEVAQLAAVAEQKTRATDALTLALDPHQRKINEISVRYFRALNRKVAPHQQEVDAIRARYRAETFEPLDAERDGILAAITQKDFEPELLPRPEPILSDDGNWLFESPRDASKEESI